MAMPSSKIFLPYVEFYITNVCNFNCTGCNRFNNYTFAGSSKWADYKDIYKEWSERLDFGRCTILGGEPMVCPDLDDWIQGIHQLWPNKQIKLLTNGSLLDPKDRGFYDIFLSDPRYLKLSIGLHNQSRLDSVLDTVQKWLTPPITLLRVPRSITQIEGTQKNWDDSYQKIRGPDWPQSCSIDQWADLPDWIKQECENLHNFTPEIFANNVRSHKFLDANGVEVTVARENFFHQGALIADKNTGRFKLHDSSPEKAHAVCHSKFCHHFESGKLYKCGQVSLFPQFYQQFYLDLDKHDLDLIQSYKPATLGMDQDSLNKWVDDLDRPMPQCKFCPESYVMSEIFAGAKKVIFKKKKNDPMR